MNFDHRYNDIKIIVIEVPTHAHEKYQFYLNADSFLYAKMLRDRGRYYEGLYNFMAAENELLKMKMALIFMDEKIKKFPEFMGNQYKFGIIQFYLRIAGTGRKRSRTG